nr:YbaN family protein [Sphingomonas colocasiae]
MRLIWLALGFFCVGLGIIGALLPLMPTTIFLILAASCFARSSPRFEAWLLDHPRFGPSLRAWRAEGAIPLRGKVAACAGITIGYAIFYWSSRPSAWLAVSVAAILAGCAAYILSRPLPRPARDQIT